MFKKSSLVFAAVLAASAGAQAAVGDSVTYSFNAQSQGNAVPTFEQATMLITETLLGVDLVLTPNWAGGGNRVDQLLFVYSGDAYTFVDGAGPTPSIELRANEQIDSGYVASPFVLAASWPASGDEKFDPADVSTSWSMNGASITLDDFLLSAVTNLQKPSPSFGVISMPGTNTQGAGSNWVAGSPGELVTAVPEPSTYALMLAGLAAIGFTARKRQQRKA